jgi:hypothetical protein
MVGVTMTEREPDHELLADLLKRREITGAPATDDPILTRRDEQKLLNEANRVEPTTLAPVDAGMESLPHANGQPSGTIVTFGAEAIEIVRRHPIPALLLAAGLAYLLTRRRHFNQ